MSVTSSSSRRPFGNPAKSPASTPSRLPVADRAAGRDARVQAQQVGLVVPGEVEPRDAGEDGSRRDRRGRSRARCRAPGRGRSRAASPRARCTPGRKPRRRPGRCEFQRSLLPSGITTSLIERVAEPRDLDLAARVADTPASFGGCAPAAGSRSRRCRALPRGRLLACIFAVAGQLLDRDLDGDRVCVEAADAVHAGAPSAAEGRGAG